MKYAKISTMRKFPAIWYISMQLLYTAFLHVDVTNMNVNHIRGGVTHLTPDVLE